MKPNKNKNPYEIRIRIVNNIVELWLGEFDNPESDLLGSFHKDYAPSVTHVLNQIHKAPIINTKGNIYERDA